MASIDESYKDNDYDDRYISTNALEYIQDGSQTHPEIKAGYSRLKIRDLIKQNQNEWKGQKISEKIMDKGLHKIFKEVVNKLKNAFPNLGKSGSKVSHFIPEPGNFEAVTILPADIKKAWLKTTLKCIKILINDQTFLMDNPEKGNPVTLCMDVYKDKDAIL